MWQHVGVVMGSWLRSGHETNDEGHGNVGVATALQHITYCHNLTVWTCMYTMSHATSKHSHDHHMIKLESDHPLIYKT